MTVAFSVILIITSLLMVLLVLLHKGKGGGLSDLFGGGISSSLGSSSVVERNLDRITIFTGIIWFICIVVPGNPGQDLSAAGLQPALAARSARL